MGNRNVERVLWAHPPITDVPASARWCLVLMAKAAHDDSQLYWAGVGWLQLRMGYPDGPGGRRTIMHYLTALEAAGYVRRTDKRKGKRVVYELHLPDMLPPRHP